MALTKNFFLRVDITRGDLRVGVLAYERRAKSEIMLNENMTFSQLAGEFFYMFYAVAVLTEPERRAKKLQNPSSKTFGYIYI